MNNESLSIGQPKLGQLGGLYLTPDYRIYLFFIFGNMKIICHLRGKPQICNRC